MLAELLAPWPIRRSANWVQHVNAVQTEAELAAIQRAILRGQPYGDDRWTKRIATRLALETTLTPRGRPRKTADGIGSRHLLRSRCETCGTVYSPGN